MRSPLFVFLPRQFLQPLSRYEEGVSFFVPIAEWQKLKPCHLTTAPQVECSTTDAEKEASNEKVDDSVNV